MKKITIDDVMSWQPRERYTRERIEKLVGKKPITIANVLKMKLDWDQDYLWVLLRPEFIPEKKSHMIAVYAAELVLHIYEEKYPGDDRPRKAIEAKKLWINGKVSDVELSKALEASMEAARAAARAAARTAAWAAAWEAAWEASMEAAWEAAGYKNHNKIISYIKKIMKVK